MNPFETQQMPYTPENAQIPIEPEIAREPLIGKAQIESANQTLMRCKQGKKQLEAKIIENEQFWKLRHWEQMRKGNDLVPATGWLWNVIVAKHADLEDGYPEPNILAREQNDKEEAQRLTSVVPVVLEQNEFRTTYSDCGWYKLKQGCAVYGVFWDKSKLNGLGDISIRKVDLLNLFWEPGVTDIQKSRNLFHIELVDNDLLEAQYPQLVGTLANGSMNVAKYMYDDTVDTAEKSIVTDWYYHTQSNGKTVLHYCKYVNDTVLYSTENEGVADGWYAHGMYPFVFDSLFNIEGSPCGYGYTDVCKDTQLNIDRLNYSIVNNALKASKTRYFIRDDGAVNENEFADWNKDFVHTNGNLGDDSIREIQTQPIDDLYVAILNNQIEMLKQTSGSTDASNGVAQSGVTAASAIAALQEASGKTSRDMLNTTYTAYKQIIIMTIELIRQFYDIPRQFRIIGERSAQQYIQYNNDRIKAQEQGVEFGVDMGCRVPQFDIDVHIQKATAYNKLAQNEFALQLYQGGVFLPQNVDQSLLLLDMMDFKGKDELIQKLQMNGSLYQQLQMYQQFALQLAAKYEPQMAQGLMSQLQGGAAATGGMPTEIAQTDSQGIKPGEHARVEQARQQTQDSTQPRQ